MKKGIYIISGLLLAVVLACGIYINDYYRAEPEAMAAFSENTEITVLQEENAFAFLPEDPVAGFVFYPGGKVEHISYAPLMLALAEKGILCVVPQMPANLAVLDMDAAEEIPGQFPEVERWYIGGHSLGGSMAANFVSRHDDYEGLVLLAAYSTADLQDTDLAVCSIYGSEDRVLDLEKYSEYRDNLPENTMEVLLQGANHAGFGSYGHQDGDGMSILDVGEQIAQTAGLIAEFMGS